MTDLRFLDPTGLVNRAAFNERLEQLNSAAFVGEDGLVDINGNGVGTRVYTGSYVGTGKYGSSNPNTLTFPAVPDIIYIGPNTSYKDVNQYHGLFYPKLGIFLANDVALSPTSVYSTISTEGNSVSWYCSSSVIQLDYPGVTYYYFAIG